MPRNSAVVRQVERDGDYLLMQPSHIVSITLGQELSLSTYFGSKEVPGPLGMVTWPADPDTLRFA